MKARDVSPSRFDAARSEAASLVRRLGEGAEIMVIEAGVQPHVTAALGRDRDRALSAIRAARPRDLPQRLPEALRTADRKSTRLNSSHLVISYAVFCLKKK